MFQRRRKSWPAWLTLLLGSEEPELSCEECFAQLDHYVERELAGADASAEMPLLKTHLEGCEACREEHQSLLEFMRSEAR
jgi:hypothetical protein